MAGVNQTQYLQDKYITNNPNELGKKLLLDAAKDGSVYSEKHAVHHPFLRDVLEKHEYYDIFLINTKGDIVYTVYKELDFATNLLDGQWKDTTLATLYKRIVSEPEKGKVFFEDFKPYSPSNNVPAAFVGTPMIDREGVFVGVLVYQMPIGRINNLTQINKEVSATAEVHLVGEDLLLRNDPNLDDKEDPILKEKRDNEASRLGFEGKTGEVWGMDGTDKTLFSYMPYDAFGTKWVIFSDILEDEALKAVRVQKFCAA